jgi:hypothetical protein
MGRVEQIEGQVQSLSADELKAFREWFARYEADIWDQQIESDAQNGKLLSLADAMMVEKGKRDVQLRNARRRT